MTTVALYQYGVFILVIQKLGSIGLANAPLIAFLISRCTRALSGGLRLSGFVIIFRGSGYTKWGANRTAKTSRLLVLVPYIRKVVWTNNGTKPIVAAAFVRGMTHKVPDRLILLFIVVKKLRGSPRAEIRRLYLPRAHTLISLAKRSVSFLFPRLFYFFRPSFVACFDTWAKAGLFRLDSKNKQARKFFTSGRDHRSLTRR